MAPHQAIGNQLGKEDDPDPSRESECLYPREIENGPKWREKR